MTKDELIERAAALQATLFPSGYSNQFHGGHGLTASELWKLFEGVKALAVEPTSERLLTALKTIRFAGRNEHPTAVWMQKVAANAMEPEKWPELPAEPPADEPEGDRCPENRGEHYYDDCGDCIYCRCSAFL